MTVPETVLPPVDPSAAPWPEAGSIEEVERFRDLQTRLPALFERIFPHPEAPRTVVVVPSLSLDGDVLAKVKGAEHYEQRMLCMLMLLRLPNTRVIYIGSTPVDPSIVDYYLHLLAGVPSGHARRRLTLLSTHDASRDHLTRKILVRPRLVERIRRAIEDPASAHMSCFVVTEAERSLAVRLGIPVYGCDPSLCHYGGKSGSRRVFREAGIAMPDGFEDLADADDVIEALAELKGRRPDIERAVVKLDEGMSGEGNAVFGFGSSSPKRPSARWIREAIPEQLTFEAEGETWGRFSRKLGEMTGIVEEWIEGSTKRSPSVQCRIDPLGRIETISTHDQILGGPSGQVFLGSTFPADPAYRLEIQEAGGRVGEILRDRGVLGRFGVDFVSVPRGDGWRHSAIEINLRKGGTTHTFMMLQFLTDGHYDPETGTYLTPSGQERCYYATDNLVQPSYRRLIPRDLIDIAVEKRLHFNAASQKGVVFHLIGAISEYGKLGAVCVAPTTREAEEMFDGTVRTLDEAAAALP